jgi:hypothetical protein
MQKAIISKAYRISKLLCTVLAAAAIHDFSPVLRNLILAEACADQIRCSPNENYAKSMEM